ncbi:hypothetical protein LEMLEM_LOCUS27834 [Lemmus lemmus]
MLCSMANSGCLLLSNSGSMLPHSVPCPPAFLYLQQGAASSGVGGSMDMAKMGLKNLAQGNKPWVQRKGKRTSEELSTPQMLSSEQNPSWDSHRMPTAPGSAAPPFPLPIRSSSAGADSLVRQHGV